MLFRSSAALANGSNQTSESTPVSSILSPMALLSAESDVNSTQVGSAAAAAADTNTAAAMTKAATTTTSPTAATTGDSNGANEVNGASATESKESQLTFQAREQIVFQPALDILPNTPLPLGHLGFKKEDIPPIVHVVTTGLETGLLAVAEFHAEKVNASGLHDLWEGRVAMDDEEP